MGKYLPNKKSRYLPPPTDKTPLSHWPPSLHTLPAKYKMFSLTACVSSPPVYTYLAVWGQASACGSGR